MKYTHLSKEERFTIDVLFNQERKSICEIAKILKRNKATISRELKRNNNLGHYDNNFAEYKRKKRQKHKFFFRLWKYKEFSNLFLQFFNKRIHGVKNTWMKIKNEYPDVLRPSWREVYHWIRQGYWSIRKSDRLRPYYVKGRKRKQGIFSKFKDKFVFPIWVRPKSIDLRKEYGHWEADFIIGKKSSGYENLITLTERTTRMIFVKKISSKNAMKCNSVLYKMIKENNLVVKSITIDNGIEFEKIGILANWIKAKIYFCEPYASYQRGTNENSNGMIRRFYKKGTNFSEISDSEITNVQDLINNMKREKLNWKSSYELFKELN